ncbi:hypothetical protein BBF96_11135 [Anoxybacter fermentans]|uniref:6-hydroxymethylpterin diphosphokinase MptE-like domain-containing protein n=1 Tax=Anoxybacter fermentans TaxID=1323375 RepID=A0A3Q9HR47_9FIRM|nr:6-hydroxymethylpterin diphosphokinase MptE-like protein [Anoxybacter fermentans]AZR73893.1 hypothetical protein BBF96_11135 [Anoxybacter fermentans]
MGEFFLIETREGTPSLGYRENEREIRLHSIYAPLREAAKFIHSRKKEIDKAKAILVYGLGMGYHLKELEKYLTPNKKVYVLEMNPKILKYTKQVFSISEYKKRGFIFLVSDNLNKVKSFISNLITEYNKDEFLLLIHQPSLKIIPENCLPIRHLLEDWEIKRETFDRYSEVMEKNFEENILRIKDYYFIEPFKNKFKDIPIVIVSAGPSLKYNKHHLLELKGKALIFAVGSVVKLLVKMGLIPDCMVITDPHLSVCRQIENLDLEIPLFFFPTIQPQIVQNYKGPKVVLFQKGFEKSENLARKCSFTLIETGGSVATTALELAIYFGGNPIIFVGQDLAYTEGKSHVEGSTSYQFKPRLNSRWVKGINGELISTGKNLSIYLKWIENKIFQNPHIQFIDATEGGAYIEGTQILSLEQVKNELDTHIQIDSLLQEALKKEMGA